jgi:hypothetical protein
VLEDWRGVDIGQIRAQLRLPFTERVRVMVEAANLLMAVQERARRGSSLPTRDIDIVPSRSSDNLDRLGRALRRMGAQSRTDGDSVPAPLDGPFLANMPMMLNLVTEFGEMDLTFVPAGRAGGYEGWRIGATPEEVSDGLMALPYLESLRDEINNI